MSRTYKHKSRFIIILLTILAIASMTVSSGNLTSSSASGADSSQLVATGSTVTQIPQVEEPSEAGVGSSGLHFRTVWHTGRIR